MSVLKNGWQQGIEHCDVIPIISYIKMKERQLKKAFTKAKTVQKRRDTTVLILQQESEFHAFNQRVPDTL